MYMLYGMMLALNVLNFGLSFPLIYKNRKVMRINASLSVKYQLGEVFLSTKFSYSVILVHVIFFGVYVSVNIAFKYFGDLVSKDPITLTIVRASWMTMISTYTFAIGPAAIYFYKKMQARREADRAKMIQMEAKGKKGAKNYDNAIANIWKTATVPID
ncbi:hypothetical protein B9Z55_010330 [Caenorhabditis nigoni]|uniref:Serpentine receptor class gamma n=2 Tax=Caenorhabditis nigoni TaxID=1611254 RepID=A0A2G5UGB0_9PELO|nr:hypothetical protein B9Z55_010330 [Caenorhabditis nigoni]